MSIQIGPHRLHAKSPLFVIAGPCVIESLTLTSKVARKLCNLTEQLGLPFIFKCSYDKGNRTSNSSFRGPGLVRGLKILSEIKSRFRVPVTSDIHCRTEIKLAASVLDLLQIPAFLCRQTDLLQEAARTGLPVNVKKGQFLAPWDMKAVIDKIEKAGNHNILVTERGTTFGYNNLVSDMRSIPILKSFGYPVVFDGTHSVQQPGGLGTKSGGQRQFASTLMKAAVAAGADGVFFETHPTPARAKSDAASMIALSQVERLLKDLVAIRKAINHPNEV